MAKMMYFTMIVASLLLLVPAEGGHMRGTSDDNDVDQTSNSTAWRFLTKKNLYLGNDLGIRFSKVEFFDQRPVGARLPLTKDDYEPMTLETAQWLRQTKAVSTVHQEDCDECDISIDKLLKYAGKANVASHPHDDPENAFWDEMLHVIKMQHARLANVDPRNVLPVVPDIWQGMTIHDVAEAVHNEFPGSHHIDLIQSFLRQGATIDRNIVPSECEVEFLRGVVMLGYVNGWAVSVVGPHNFLLKWHVGRARPENVAYAIYNGDIARNHVPPEVYDGVMAMSFALLRGGPTAFTAYPEGSPMHPSWPAMHSAASAGSMWLPVVMNLTPEQICQARALDYAISYGRTVAGVHYPTDNIAGLKLGQAIVAKKLPRFLDKTYKNVDKDAVKAKIELMKFDWDDYLQSECVPASPEEVIEGGDGSESMGW